MRFIVEIGHPAHVHHFKHMYWELEKRGHQGLFVAKDKECALDLLRAYSLPFALIGKTQKGMLKKLLHLMISDIRMLHIAKSFRPDIFISRVAPASAHVSRILGKPHICFADTESSKGFDWIVLPCVDAILTSIVYKRDHGSKQIRYPGYHELAYLHPNRFEPDADVLTRAGLRKGERFAIVRFVSWNAHHDVGLKGISYGNKRKLIEMLSAVMRVLISSEDTLPADLQQYQIEIKPEDMHSVLAFAHLFVGESATMASECACLGVPAIYIDNVGRGYTSDQQDRYGLVFNYNETEQGQQQAILKATQLAARNHNDETYKVKRRLLLNDMIDVSQFMEWFASNYPHSRKIMRDNGFNWEQFKIRN